MAKPSRIHVCKDAYPYLFLFQFYNHSHQYQINNTIANSTLSCILSYYQHYTFHIPNSVRDLLSSRLYACVILGNQMEIMDPANLSTTLPPFRLLNLPLELQRVIFGHALYTETTLHRPTEVEHDGDVLISPATNILRVSSRIKKETLPIFYQVNHFHCDQFLDVADPVQCEHMPPLPPIFLRSLHMIRHISIHAFYKNRYRMIHRDFLEESVLANALVHIERHAPNLRTLAIHFGPFSGITAFPVSIFKLIINGSIFISIITALCRLRARLERLSLVYFGLPRGLEKIWSNIAPREDWTVRILDSWPVTLSPIRTTLLKGWEGPYKNSRIRVLEIGRCPELHAGDREL